MQPRSVWTRKRGTPLEVKLVVGNLSTIIRVEKGYITRKTEEVILEKVYSEQVMKMIGVNQDVMDLIDWEAHRSALMKSKSVLVPRIIIWGGAIRWR